MPTGSRPRKWKCFSSKPKARKLIQILSDRKNSVTQERAIILFYWSLYLFYKDEAHSKEEDNLLYFVYLFMYNLIEALRAMFAHTCWHPVTQSTQPIKLAFRYIRLDPGFCSLNFFIAAQSYCDPDYIVEIFRNL